MKKTTIRIISAIIAIALIVGLLSPVLFMAFATDVNSTLAEDTAQDETGEQEEQDDNPFESANDARDEMERLQAEIDKVQDSIDSLESGIQQNENTKVYYEQQAALLAQQIEAMKADIAFQEAALAQKHIEHEAKIQEHAQTTKLFEDRLAAIYMVRNSSSVEVLLGTTAYSEASRYDENLQHITLSDTQLMDKLKAEEIALKAQADDIDALITELNAAKEKLDATSANYAATLQKINEDLTQQEALKQAQELSQEELIKQYNDAQASWQEFITSGNNHDFEYNGATFAWPLPGYFRIRSDYNVARILPNGIRDVHRGIDMPAPSTAIIYASAEGYVTTTGMHWSYGNAVKIDHGSGLISLYAHMSSMYVKNGDYVMMGDAIGTVGNTGNSFGNHLHYEVNLNGYTVNPRNYLAAEDIAKLYY